ncbi:MAG: MFS transporter [Ectothiorhodospiraceae bacterium]|nr:MFS transporter [Ectothiorhodospiraceae bacterium]
MTTSAKRPATVPMVLAGMFVALVVIVFARLAYGMILPAMRADLQLSYQQAGMLGTVTALGYLVLVLAGGVAAARWGAKQTVVLGLAIVGTGFAGLALASSYPLIVALMALLGFGTAFCFAPMVSLLATWYPEKRGQVIGYMSAGIGLGLLITGTLVPLLLDLFGTVGWRVAWGVFAASAVATGLLVIAVVRNPPVEPVGPDTRPATADKWLVYTNPRVLVVATIYGIIGLCYIVQAVFMVSYVVESGFSEAVAGWLLAMSGLLSVASAPVWGSLSDRLGRANALTAAMLLVTLSMGVVLVSQSLLAFFLHFLLIGCSLNGTFTTIQAASTDQVPPRYIPIAFSFATLLFAGGQLVGPAVAGWLIETTGDFRAAIAFTCVGLATGIYLTQRMRRFPAEPAAIGRSAGLRTDKC